MNWKAIKIESTLYLQDIGYNDFHQFILSLICHQIKLLEIQLKAKKVNGFNSLFIATPITASLNWLPKNITVISFKNFFKFRSDFLTIYDPYMFLTRGKYLQYDKKRKKEVKRKCNSFGHNEYDRNIDKLKINEKEVGISS